MKHSLKSAAVKKHTRLHAACVAFLLMGIAGVAADSPAAKSSTKPTRKPNIILIYSDDHGFADVGAQGVDSDIRTPNLDALAHDGVRFTHGYVSAPQCVPSRAGVITGRYQERFGVDDNNLGPMPLEEITIAERLKSAGYISAQVGKWHLEPPPGAYERANPPTHKGPFAYLPVAQGFDEYYTGQMNDFVASHTLAGEPLADAPKRLKDLRFRCVWQADAAISFVKRHADSPFFLYLAFFAPHVPLESPEPWFSKTPANLPMERRQALAMIAAMDDGIGRLRATLREKGIEQDTLIFFIGDNGAPLRPGAWNGSLNTPWIGEKGMLTDGGVRTPFLAAWPGKLSAGKSFEPMTSSLDVAATAVALAGLPVDAGLDGVNIIPYLTGEKTGEPHDVLFWRWRTQAAVREVDWKLILLGPSKKYLFKNGEPEDEAHNQATAHPEIVDRLYARLTAWDATLKTPGLPTAVNRADQYFYDAHVEKKADAQPVAKPGRRKPAQ